MVTMNQVIVDGPRHPNNAEISDLVVEIRSTVRRVGPVKLVPLEEVYNYRGFRSAFAFPTETTAIILEQQSTQGLRGLPVYADTIFMDFDGPGFDAFRTTLQSGGLAYQEYHSGGRSIHFHIPIVPALGVWLPGAVKQWIRERTSSADVSFVHSAGMYRLPNTYHPKYPGKRKTLVDEQQGTRVSLAPPLIHVSTGPIGDADETAVLALMTQRRGEGRRRPHLWLLATTAAEAGLPLESTIEHALWWSERFSDPPHDPETVRRQCELAYQRRQR